MTQAKLKKFIWNSLEDKEKTAHFNKCFIQTAATLFSPFCALLNFKDLRRIPHILTRNLSILPLASSFTSVTNFEFLGNFWLNVSIITLCILSHSKGCNCNLHYKHSKMGKLKTNWKCVNEFKFESFPIVDTYYYS